MALEADRELAALVAREQRGFRFILISGIVLLLLLLALSVVMTLQMMRASSELKTTQIEMQRDIFDARLSMTDQGNKAADASRRLRRLSQDLRRPEFQTQLAVTPASAFESAHAFLREGRLTIEDERQIEGGRGIGSPALQSLMLGAYTLMNWERLGDQVARGAEDLPNRLLRAVTQFEEAARLDPSLATTAAAGRGWVHYIRASQLSNYADVDCGNVSDAVAASAENGAIGAQALWWRAQCERKAGRADEALRDYALALEQTYDAAVQRGQGMRNRQAELAVAMNAYHGLGTTLIALRDRPDNDPSVARAMAVGERACTEGATSNGFDLKATTPRLLMAERCLRAAMETRRRLGQTEAQINGTGENLTFIYLAENNHQAALEHAAQVERSGLSAWNELMRALTAERGNSDETRRAAREARLHVGFFDVRAFSLCELRRLLGEELYAEAEEIVREAHPDEQVGCAASN